MRQRRGRSPAPKRPQEQRRARGPRERPQPVGEQEPLVRPRIEPVGQRVVRRNGQEPRRRPRTQNQEEHRAAEPRGHPRRRPSSGRDRRGELGHHQRHHERRDHRSVPRVVRAERGRADLREQRVVHELNRPDEPRERKGRRELREDRERKSVHDSLRCRRGRRGCGRRSGRARGLGSGLTKLRGARRDRCVSRGDRSEELRCARVVCVRVGPEVERELVAHAPGITSLAGQGAIGPLRERDRRCRRGTGCTGCPSRSGAERAGWPRASRPSARRQWPRGRRRRS